MLKQLRQWRRQQLQKNNRFNYQNNRSARASRSLVHFFDVYCKTTTWNLLLDNSWRTWTYHDEFSFLFLILNKILKNSTPGKVVCIWHIERVQIDAIKFERMQMYFLATFSLLSSLSLLKVPIFSSQLSLNGNLYKTDTLLRRTPRVGPCLSLLPLLDQGCR